jgi:hypothetical protein
MINYQCMKLLHKEEGTAGVLLFPKILLGAPPSAPTEYFIGVPFVPKVI